MKILVTGSNGQVGLSFQKIAPLFKNVNWHFTDRTKLDISDKEKVKNLVNRLCPDVIINCAAYTAVDKAESEPEMAYQINGKAVENLAIAAYNNNCLLVHYSTDYVYHNGQKQPLKEDDPKSPKGVYAMSKLQGEENIINCQANAIIIRTSWVYSEFGGNFLKTMIRLGRERDELTIVDDQIGSPTYATDIATDTMKMITRYSEVPERLIITNYTADGKISWYDFAVEIFKIKNIHTNVLPIASKCYPTPADRPKNSVLNLDYCRTMMKVQIRPWKASVIKCIELLESN